MSKNTEIKFVGQPIFKQIVNLTDAVNIESLVRKHNSDYYYKAFKSRTHLITMLFGLVFGWVVAPGVADNQNVDADEIARRREVVREAVTRICKP